MEDEIVELTREGERPERTALGADTLRVVRGRRGGRGHGDLGDPALAVKRARNLAVADRVARDGPLERREPEPPRVRPPVGARRKLPGALDHDPGEPRARPDPVPHPPLDGALAPDPPPRGAEDAR